VYNKPAAVSSDMPGPLAIAQSTALETTKTSRIRPPLHDGEIRILALHAGDVRDPIVCSLHVAVLDELPVYEALSYTWGDPNVTWKICVDGVEVDVTMNLEIALR
jgi:hypothetical protein